MPRSVCPEPNLAAREGPMFQTITAEGIDMSDALDNMFLENTKRPDLTHLQAIIFSERLAKEGYGMSWTSCVGMSMSVPM